MVKFILKRFLLGVPITLGILTLVFVMLRMAPGDPIQTMLGDHATPQLIAALNAKYGLDQPLYVQWWRYVSSIARGDFGFAITTNRKILPDLLLNLKYTLQLMAGSMLIAVVVGIPLGVVTAVKRNTWIDHGLRILSLTGVSMPPFWFGILLIIVFSLRLDLFPVIGAGNPGDFPDIISHLVLPSLTLGLSFSASIMRVTRSTMLEVLGDQYIVTARAKGLSRLRVLYKHALKNAMIPVVTVIGLQVGRMVGIGLVVETVFSRPGLGTFLVNAIFIEDYPVVQATIVFASIVVVVINILVDVGYCFLDPRIEL